MTQHNEADERIEAIWALFRDGDIDRALEQTLAIERADPAWGRAKLLEGNLRLVRREMALAQAALEAALTVRPRDPDAWNNLGNVHAVAGRVKEAQDAFERALAIEPRHRDATVNLGTLAAVSGDAVTAERHLRAACEIAPENPLPRRSLAGLLVNLGRLDEAEAELTAAVAGAPADVEAMAALARLYSGRGKLPEAIAVLERLLVLDHQARGVHAAIAECLIRGEQPQAALKHLEQALAETPDDPAVLTNLGVARMALGDAPAARAALAQALTLNAAFLPASMNLARVALMAGDAATAVDVADAAVRAAPGESRAREYLINLLLRVNRAADAVVAARAGVNELPKNTELLNLLGIACQAAGDTMAAGEAFRAAIALEPHSQGTWLNLAQSQLHSGRAQEALVTLGEALGHFPDSTYGQAMLGRAREMLGDRDGARAAYQVAVAADPRNLMAWDALAGLSRAANDTRGMIDVYRRARQANPSFDRSAFPNLGSLDID